MHPAVQSEVTLLPDGRGGLGGSTQQQGSGEWRTPALSGILQSLACRDFTRAFQGEREPGGCRDSGRLARHTAWFCQTTSCSSPPASEFPGILARAPVGFSLWLAVSGRAYGAPVLFFFVMRRLQEGAPMAAFPQAPKARGRKLRQNWASETIRGSVSVSGHSKPGWGSGFFCLRSC